jgi:hypothetical protein
MTENYNKSPPGERKSRKLTVLLGYNAEVFYIENLTVRPDPGTGPIVSWQELL